MNLSWRWPLAVLGLIGLNVALVTLTVYFATNDPSAGTEPDYYQKAVEWDRVALQRDRSAQLGWTSSIEVQGGRVRVALRDRAGAPVENARVELVMFPAVRPKERREIVLSADAAGYAAAFEAGRAGVWEVALEATRGADAYIRSTELELNNVDSKAMQAGRNEP